MMGSNERISEENEKKYYFSYNSQGVLNHFSPVDGEQVAPHAPSKEEYYKRMSNRSYRLAAEKKYKESR